MRTRRVSHLPVAKGTKQWTPRLQSIVVFLFLRLFGWQLLDDGLTSAIAKDRKDSLEQDEVIREKKYSVSSRRLKVANLVLNDIFILIFLQYSLPMSKSTRIVISVRAIVSRTNRTNPRIWWCVMIADGLVRFFIHPNKTPLFFIYQCLLNPKMPKCTT